ncbi:hypothetical protein BU24DRAFT_417250 [Aaosphaeria arxii CBS 175.79]|uniref:DUF7730 domain-containing protein n=1 Tax=Aaosphaeria arxii CBS 175.79 TaxID=1450172 RepID=A0A6A5YA42_9PLEO|nr:uncharacterized protein BU24DRAFT_417250 [Aaosphaeria arxii CBS 175.79]KAF2021621.1 hypothetical protein BU24DRAFT_417250 [Aaosphaeria arxii CBS 175.79]
MRLVNYIKYGNTDCRMFESPPQSSFHHKTQCDSLMDMQHQSPFFKLPAETRNQIYFYVFSDPGTSEQEQLRDESSSTSPASTLPLRTDLLSRCNPISHFYRTNPNVQAQAEHEPPHPLSLLQTCRLVHNEANLLAFSHHTFSLSFALIRKHPLKILLHPLPPSKVSTITRISHDLGPPSTYYQATANCGQLLNYCLLLFPSLAVFTIELCVDKDAYERASQADNVPRRVAHYNYLNGVSIVWCPGTDEDDGMTGLSEPERQAVKKFAPHWFRQLLTNNDRAFRWPKEEEWAVEWPQYSSRFMTEMDHDGGSRNGIIRNPAMEREAVRSLDGVDPCVCGCKDLCWTSVDMVQRTGRRVKVRAVVHGREGLGDSPFIRFKLEPGTERHELTVDVNGDTGLLYEPTQGYWDALRWKSTFWGRMAMPFARSPT